MLLIEVLRDNLLLLAGRVLHNMLLHGGGLHMEKLLVLLLEGSLCINRRGMGRGRVGRALALGWWPCGGLGNCGLTARFFLLSSGGLLEVGSLSILALRDCIGGRWGDEVCQGSGLPVLRLMARASFSPHLSSLLAGGGSPLSLRLL